MTYVNINVEKIISGAGETTTRVVEEYYAGGSVKCHTNWNIMSRGDEKLIAYEYTRTFVNHRSNFYKRELEVKLNGEVLYKGDDEREFERVLKDTEFF